MQNRTLGYFSFIFISVIWGTTYLVTRIGVMHFPAILFTGIRQLSAGLILLAALWLAKVNFSWKWKDIYPQIVSGILIIALGNGMVSWAVRYIPSGLSALLCTVIPMNMILIGLMIEKTQKINLTIILGIILGLGGMIFIFRDNIADIGKAEYAAGIIITLIATIAWSVGSVYSKIMNVDCHPLYKAALQLTTGGIVLLIVSIFTDNWQTVTMPDTKTLGALLYLTFLGSIAAFAAYQYALSVLPAGLVSVYAYINPLIAVLLGYIVLHERLTWYTFIAFSLTVMGVYAVNLGYKVQKNKLAIK